MAPIFTGALQPKKKSELQDIALALHLSDQGTKDELQTRIKKHLDQNQASLEEDPAFAGLFNTRRKKSVQPQSAATGSRPVRDQESAKPPSKSQTRRITALDAIQDSTPVADLRDVSAFLKNPTSPTDASSTRSAKQAQLNTPSNMPLLPPKQADSLVERISGRETMGAFVHQVKQNEILQSSRETLNALRFFLSNSRNIWSLTALGEFFYVLYAIIPWKTVQIPLSLQDKFVPASFIFYPPLSAFQTYAFWMALLHWAIPTLILPAMVGNLISFNPAAPYETTGFAPFDPLTASIIRLAAQISYPYTYLDRNIYGLDVLGFRWRVLNAAVSLAFSFAEAVSRAPQLFAKTLIREEKVGHLLGAAVADEVD